MSRHVLPDGLNPPASRRLRLVRRCPPAWYTLGRRRETRPVMNVRYHGPDLRAHSQMIATSCTMSPGWITAPVKLTVAVLIAIVGLRITGPVSPAVAPPLELNV